MWLGETARLAHADRVFLRDLAEWGGIVHSAYARVLLDGIKSAGGIDERKALSSRLVETQFASLIALGQLYVAVRGGQDGSIVQSRLAVGFETARRALQQVGRGSGAAIWELLRLPDPESPQLGEADKTQHAAYVAACGERSLALRRVSTIVRENMLLASVSGEAPRMVLVSGPRPVSEIKTGRERESEAQAETAFLIVDTSGGCPADAGDLVAVACPTRLPVLEEIVNEVKFISEETAATARLVGLALDFRIS